MANIPNSDKPINSQILNDPENPLVWLILFIHSMETFVYDVLHQSMT